MQDNNPHPVGEDVVWKIMLVATIGIGIVTFKGARRLVRLVRRFPATITIVTLLALGWWRLGTAGLGVVLGALALVLVVWWARWRWSFRRFVGNPVRYYRRRRKLRANWTALTYWHGLASTVHVMKGRRPVQKIVTPKLRRRISCSWWRTRLTLRPVTGQSAQTWQAQTEGLCTALACLDLRVSVPRLPTGTGLRDRVERRHLAGRLYVDVIHGDPLANVVPARPLPRVGSVDLHRVPIGRQEDERPFTVALAGNHLLVVGATGSGKGSVLWNILQQLGPAIPAGLVRLWVLDPKGGMELGRLETVAYAYADDTPGSMVALLEDANVEMDHQAKQLKARRIRRHIPTVEFPLNVVVVDEMIDITKFKGDLGKKGDAALGGLLRKGRGVGFSVLAAGQEPRVNAIPHRDGFPTRIALRLAKADQVDLVLGDGAWEAGAHCEKIPGPLLGSDGIGYALEDGHKLPVRFRAAWMDDPDIDALVDHWDTRPQVLNVREAA
jgi:S-DNA-T family DNA segregation ATPase FtsK/SpoIIIE